MRAGAIRASERFSWFGVFFSSAMSPTKFHAIEPPKDTPVFVFLKLLIETVAPVRSFVA